MTPLWTEGTPGAAARFGVTDDVCITANEVAAAIDEAVESTNIPGGAIFEITKVGTRVVPEWNFDPPPGTQDGKMAKGTAVPPERIEKILEPILKLTEAERGKL